MSSSLKVVRIAAVCWARTSRSAMRCRMGLMGTTLSAWSAPAAGVSAGAGTGARAGAGGVMGARAGAGGVMGARAGAGGAGVAVAPGGSRSSR